jgi:hypothetical protein
MVFNAPWVFTFLGYVAGILALGIRDRALGLRTMHIANLTQTSAGNVYSPSGTWRATIAVEAM